MKIDEAESVGRDIVPPSDVAFTPAVKQVQQERGSRTQYARMEQTRGWETTVTPQLAAFIAERDSFYLATASRDGQPYVQHRGGPPGFLRVVDEHTLAFTDFVGNKQYITTGNLRENDKTFLFLMDYAHRTRVKMWGRAEVVSDPEMMKSLMPVGYNARAEQAIVFHLTAWDSNCQQHIPQLIPAKAVAERIAGLERRIRELEVQLAERDTKN
jgi:predicted pyridoxine 5'-phosphate oxidase superfamily flavin-nucleotide-binding protein